MQHLNFSHIHRFLATCAVLLALAACSKDTGDYHFENKLNVYAGTTYEYLQHNKGIYDSLLLVAERVPWLKDSLQNGKLTAFAPTNSSFDLVIRNMNALRKTAGKSPLYLATVDPLQLDTLSARYFASSLYMTDSLLFTDGVYFTSIRYNRALHAQILDANASGYVAGGPKNIYFSDTRGSKFQRDWQRTTTQAVNIKTSNGVIHILVPTHEFGFGEFVLRMNK